jgi:hypothetical protein
MKEFRTRAIINAPAFIVWNTITTLDDYPKFDPNFIRIEGKVKNKEQLKIHYKPCSKWFFKAKVKDVRRFEIMVWEWGLPFNLFKGIRTFIVTAKDDQTTEFEMVEAYSGHLLPIFASKFAHLHDPFHEFARGLKRFIESRP